jgi:two-component SAPR family response regulator
MRVIIIEDELLAQAKLESMLHSSDPSIEVVAKITSVKEALYWLSHHTPPDLAFVDIQLSDDHSFAIFKKQPIGFPVIFTTAYDKYLLESFEFNSIDYLLKPITEEKLKRSLDKIKKLERHFLHGSVLGVC